MRYKSKKDISRNQVPPGLLREYKIRFHPFPSAKIRQEEEWGKNLVAKINQIFAIGCYNYESGSNKIQFTLKLHYKTLTPADITASIEAYYDACVLYYLWTAPALAAMHGDMLETLQSLSESAILDYQYK